MRRALAAALVLLVLGSCLSSKTSTKESATFEANNTGELAATAGGAAAKGGFDPLSVPAGPFDPPESRRIFQERTFHVADELGAVQRFREKLYADGSGEFRLEIESYSPSASDPFLPPGSWAPTYEWRQRYLVLMRDLHVGDAPQVHRNYVWSVDRQGHSIAGRLAKRYRGVSRHGFGSIEVDVDVAENLILGWQILDENDELIAKLVTRSVDFQPDLQGIQWSQPNAPEQAYRGAIDDPLLGFAPEAPRYVPPGFTTERVVMVMVQQTTLGEPNLHVEYLSDGLQTLIVAQQKAASAGGWSSAQRTIHEAVLGGIRVLDTRAGDRRVFLVGSLPSAELMGVLGSMLL